MEPLSIPASKPHDINEPMTGIPVPLEPDSSMPLAEIHIEELLGTKLLKKHSRLSDKERETRYAVEEIDIAEVKQARFVLLFFSAGWCQPCNEFLQVLKDFYNEVNIDKKQVEIVFISSDNEESGFRETYA